MSYRGYRSWIRCNHCRTRRATGTQIFMHLLQSPDCAPCTCGGYHFAHRRGSPYCEAHPDCDANRASRAGATDDEVKEIQRRVALLRECPF